MLAMATRILVGTRADLAYTLVDGRNFFHRQWGKYEVPFLDESQKFLIRKTKDNLPGRMSQVIVVWTMGNWTGRNLHKDTPAYHTRRMQYARMLQDLAAPGTNVIFLLYDYIKPTNKNVYKCIGEYGNCKRAGLPEKQCQLPQQTGYSHLACEMDDVLLTILDGLLTAQNRATQVMTNDKQVLKSPEDVEKVETLVKAATGVPPQVDRLQPAIEIAEVPLSWS